MSRSTTGNGLPGSEPFSEKLEQEMKAALAALGPTYLPRTKHLRADGTPRFTNRLIFATSPYLLQHAHNPVSWFSWGEEAFQAAAALNRPILLSVGYSTCHWCHVMEVESFEDEEIAAYINTNYIAIKVDREERPDVDSVYMSAVQLLSQGGGGWPMTVVMTPEKRPFFGGTYFPPRDGMRGSRVGFLTILKRIKEAYQLDPSSLKKSAQEVAAALQLQSKTSPQGIPGREALVEAARVLTARYDPKYGGFGSAPKFPRPSTYEFMLRYFRRTNDPVALEVVSHSLDQMVAGGIYDQLGGGFHRYSTDERWLVPHFEKMLYDNAQLASLLAELQQLTGEYRAPLVETLEYVLREMTSPQGAFYSATDADSEDHEGTFFVWTPAQLETVLGERRGKIAQAIFGVTNYGNFEGKNILHRMRPLEEVAQELGLSEAALHSELPAIKAELYAARENRIHPLRDDKILVEWNAQMISGFAKASIALDETKWAEHGERAADFIFAHMYREGRLVRAHRSGRSQHAAVLEDYAFSIAAMLDLFEATAKKKWLEKAIELEATLERYYLDRTDGAFYSTADDAEALLVREKSIYDGAQPSGNSVAATNLLRLAEFTGRREYRNIAEGILRAFGGSLERGAVECPKLIQALDFLLDSPKEIVIVTGEKDDGAQLRKVLRENYLPNSVSLILPQKSIAEMASIIPWLENKVALKDKATAYVCRAQVCDAPTSDPEIFAKQLEKKEPFEPARKLVVPR